MKITVITGSPHKKGTSALLADKFIEGARAAGHDIFRFNAAFENVKPCLGCDHCLMGSNACVYQDAMRTLNPELLTADFVVFVTPLYYWGMSVQLKIVIDRFYANNTRLMGSQKRAMLMATSYDANEWTMSALIAHYQALTKYLQWRDAGMLLATGVGNRSAIERTPYPEQAHEWGKQLHERMI